MKIRTKGFLAHICLVVAGLSLVLIKEFYGWIPLLAICTIALIAIIIIFTTAPDEQLRDKAFSQRKLDFDKKLSLRSAEMETMEFIIHVNGEVLFSIL